MDAGLPLFTDSDGEPLRFFLPMSLVSRSAFKDKIESNGGVLVQSELMTNIIKIGDPGKPQSYDASWLNFRYIDDALREGQLQNPEFYVMDNPGLVGHHHQQQHLPQQMMPTTQRQTPSSGGLTNGIGSRGTRQEFTPEEDDILRRIVHRPRVATSGNKIYQLIAQHYGGHSFHSWRDRYIRHMRPIWGPPTTDAAMDLNPTDNFILTQSSLRAPHAGSQERGYSERPTPMATQAHAPMEEEEEDFRRPETPSTGKKQRAAFSTTDDEILLRAIAETGETAATYKSLGQRHPHHTWESWKNRVKALKKKAGGVLPDYTQGLSLADLSDLDLSIGDHTENLKALQQAGEDHHDSQDLVDPNIDPNLQLQQQLSMIMDDPNEQAFERHFQDDYGATQDLHMQQQLQQEDAEPSPFVFSTATEEILRQGLQGHNGLDLSQQGYLEQPEETSRRGIKRHINIHDPSLDENLGRVSDIEDASQTQTRGKRGTKRIATKKRKTNAAARAAAERAAAVPKLTQTTPATPSRQVEQQTPHHVKSAKQEHHEREKTGLVPAVREHASQDFLVEIQEPRTRAAKARAASQEPQPLHGAAEAIEQAKGKQWAAIQNRAKSTETFVRSDQSPVDGNMNEDDDLMAEEQIKQSVAKRAVGRPRKTAASMPIIDEDGFVQTNDLLRPNYTQTPRTTRSSRAQGEVRATPDSSPVRPPVSQLRAINDSPAYSTAFDAPSPTPASPNQSFSQSQFLQDSQAIRGDLDFDFDTTIQELGLNSEEQELQAQLQQAAEQRKQNWIERQATNHHIPYADAEDAWNRTCGVQSLAVKVVQAYQEGRSPPRLPGIWTDEDDNIIRSADAQALEEVDRFHRGAVESRLLYLGSME